MLLPMRQGHKTWVIGRGAATAAVAGVCLLTAGVATSARAGGIWELFLPSSGGTGAVEWQAQGDDETGEGVTLVAVRVSGRDSALGLIEGAWHAPVTGPTVLWHDGDPALLPGYVPSVADAAMQPIQLPMSVGWADVGWAVFAGDVTAMASLPFATLAAGETRAALGESGLLAGVSVAATGGVPWVPNGAELVEMGAAADAWGAAAVGEPGVYLPTGDKGWLGGAVAGNGVVIGDGYWFVPTPGVVNVPVRLTHYPEPSTGWLVTLGLIAAVARRRSRGGKRCGRVGRGI